MVASKELKFLNDITDDFGVWQHTYDGVINKGEGYALDDSARALIVYLLYNERELATVCLNYIEASLKDGKFIGFFNKEREPVVYPSSNDAFGLVVWALAFCIGIDFQANISRRILSKLNIESVIIHEDIRTVAYLLIAMSYLKDEEVAIRLVEILVRKYNSSLVDWFEDHLYYGNAAIPYSLLIYLNTFKTRDPIVSNIVLGSISTLEREMYIGVIPAPVGNRKWCKIGTKTRDVYGQQPIDSSFMIMLYLDAYDYFRESEYYIKAKGYLEWFHGNNIWRASLISASNACSDGIDSHGISNNYGAESTIMYLWAKKLVEEYN